MAKTRARTVRTVLRLSERGVAEPGHREEPRPDSGLHALHLQQKDEGRDLPRLQGQRTRLVPVPVSNHRRNAWSRSVLMKPGHGPRVVAKEAMALHTPEFAETRSIVTRALAVAAEEPAKRSGNTSRPSLAATLVRIWVELGPNDRGLLEREGLGVLLLSEQPPSRTTARNRSLPKAV